MAFSSTAAFQLWPGSLANGRGAGWMVLTTDSTSAASATGWLAGAMRGGRGSSTIGMSTGDVCFVHHLTGGAGVFTSRIITGSTADQASTSTSTGFNASYNGTLTP
ncbi:MAG: hypothetical protein M5U08_16460 [Burkholderiales bacterium]|nr:hypothetical protein [Burkholderiales bacterium]